jgi:hypothetical protein
MSITNIKSEVLKTARNSSQSENLKNFTDNVIEPPEIAGAWVRPADWLTLPTFSPGEQKAVALFFLEEDSNFFHVNATTSAGTYTVDWGDGSPTETFASAATAYHQFNWDDVSSSTLTSDGFKQVIVTITPTTANLTNVHFRGKHNQARLQDDYNYYIMDIAINAPYMTSLNLAKSNSDSTYDIRFYTKHVYIGENNITNYTCAFRFMNFLEEVEIYEVKSGVTLITSMFEECISLKSIKVTNAPAELASVTIAYYAFRNCKHLKSIPEFFLRLPACSDFGSAFAYCSALKTITLTGGTAANAGNMFEGCLNLKNIIFKNVKLNYCAAMFRFCYSLEETPFFDSSTCTTFDTCFYQCFSLKKIPAYNYGSCTSFANMFFGCRSLEYLEDNIFRNTSKITTVANMFDSCTNLKKAPFFDTSSVTSFSSMFRLCYVLVDVPTYNTVKATAMDSMFSSCYSLTYMPPFDTNNVTSFSSQFLNCYSLKNVPFHDTAKATSFSSRFSTCYSLEEYPWTDTRNVTNFASAFFACGNLRKMPALNYGKATPTAMDTIFSYTTNLNTVDFGNVPLDSYVTLPSVATTSFGTYSAKNLKTIKGVNLSNANCSGSTIYIVDSNWGPFTLSNLEISGSFTCNLNISPNSFSSNGVSRIMEVLPRANIGRNPFVQVGSGTTSFPGRSNSTVRFNKNNISNVHVYGSFASNIEVGMFILGEGSPLVNPVPVTITAAGNSIAKVDGNIHGFAENTLISFANVTTTSGINWYEIYQANVLSPTSFSLRNVTTGNIVTLTNDGTGNIRYPLRVVSFTPNVSLITDNFASRLVNSNWQFTRISVANAYLRGWTLIQ